MRKLNIFYILFFFGFIFLVFRSWFFSSQIIGGDWPYLFPEMLRDPSIYFSSWNPGQGNGLGGINPVYSLSMFLGFTVFLAHTFSIPWVFIYKFFWFILPLFLGILSSLYLIKTIFPQSALWQKLLASFIFTVNTYFLMIASGGQMGIALAYSMSPLVLASFMRLIGNLVSVQLNFKFQISNFKFPMVAGLILAVQVMFDPRIAYLSMLIVGIYIVFSLLFVNFFSKKIFSFFLPLMFFGFGLPVFVAGLLHAVWLLPILFFQSNPIPQGLTSVAGFRFFSFADFSHAFSLLHPNWPENIFGKTYFLKPEFLVLPVIAYSSLLFISSKFKVKSSKLQFKIQRLGSNLTIEQWNNRAILFFAFLGLFGAFLAKGASPPFGEINIFLFEHIPGMSMFRDPTKFYLLIVLSYSALIPFSIYSIYKWLSAKCKMQSAKLSPQMRDPAGAGQFKVKSYIPELFLLFTICYLLFLVRPAIFGQLGGTFRDREVPPEYVRLKDFLYKQQGFFRTLWIPRQSRFAYSFWGRMPVEAEPLLKKTKIADIVNELHNPEKKEYLSDLGIKYIIVPYDPYGEIFVKDRKYDSLAYQQAISQLEAVPWLKKIDGFGKIAVFETASFEDYFRLDEGGALTYEMINPSEYRVFVDINLPTSLIFSENYHSEWIAIINSTIIKSQKTKSGTNGFQLIKSGSYKIDVRFYQERFYDYGKIVSLMILLLILFLIF